MEQVDWLLYSNDTDGPFRLYIFDRDGSHRGGLWFNRTIRYPDEEISIAAAKRLADAAVAMRREVRICDGGDKIVFHSVDGLQLYPELTVDFWKRIQCR